MTAHAVSYEENPASWIGNACIFVGSPDSSRIASSTVFNTQSVTPEYSTRLICPAEQKQPPKDISLIIHFFALDRNY